MVLCHPLCFPRAEQRGWDAGEPQGWGIAEIRGDVLLCPTDSSPGRCLRRGEGRVLKLWGSLNPCGTLSKCFHSLLSHPSFPWLCLQGTSSGLGSTADPSCHSRVTCVCCQLTLWCQLLFNPKSHGPVQEFVLFRGICIWVVRKLCSQRNAGVFHQAVSAIHYSLL